MHRPRRSIFGLLRNHAVAEPVEPVQILIARRLWPLPRARPQSLTVATHGLGQRAFPTTPLHITIRQKACLIAERNSSPPYPSNRSLPLYFCAGAQWRRSRNARPAYRAQARIWPASRRPCSLFHPANTSAEFYIG